VLFRSPLRATAPPDTAAAGQLVIHRVEIRWRDGIGTGHRIGLGARSLAIRAAFDPDARRRRLVLRCEEIRP
jgi:head-tail adaptor